MLSREERRVWQNVFCTPEGEAVLANILNRLGWFSDNDDMIDGKLIAVGNWILNQIGIVSVENLASYIHSIADSASYADIDAFEKQMEEKHV